MDDRVGDVAAHRFHIHCAQCCTEEPILISSDRQKWRGDRRVRESEAASHATDLVHDHVAVRNFADLARPESRIKSSAAARQHLLPGSLTEEKPIRVCHTGISGDAGKRHSDVRRSHTLRGAPQVRTCAPGIDNEVFAGGERPYRATQHGVMRLQQADPRAQESLTHIVASAIERDVPQFDMSAQRYRAAKRPRPPHIAHDVVVNEQHVLAAGEEENDVPVSRGAGVKGKLEQRVVAERAERPAQFESFHLPDERDLLPGGVPNGRDCRSSQRFITGTPRGINDDDSCAGSVRCYLPGCRPQTAFEEFRTVGGGYSYCGDGTQDSKAVNWLDRANS